MEVSALLSLLPQAHISQVPAPMKTLAANALDEPLSASRTLTPQSLCCFVLGNKLLLGVHSTSHVDFSLYVPCLYFQSSFSVLYFIEILQILNTWRAALPGFQGHVGYLFILMFP